MQSQLLAALLVSGGACLILDQCTKWIVRTHVADRRISCGPLLKIRRVAHAKPAFNRPAARIAFALTWFVALASAILLYRAGAWFQGSFAQCGLGVALGGAAGNLWDIQRRRYILDFLDLRWWPVFNLADVAIVAGLIAAFWPRT